MPIFEFRCGKCGHEFEELVFKRDEKVACPKCANKRVSKRMSTFAHHGGGGNGGGLGDLGGSSASSGSGCAGCSGGSCSTCH